MTQQNVTASPLPFPSVPLEDQGVQALLALGRLNPSFAAAVVAQLQSNPRQAISRLFNLTPAQRDAIDSSPDAELAARVAPAIEALQNRQLNGWEFAPTGAPSASPDVACECHIKFSS